MDQYDKYKPNSNIYNFRKNLITQFNKIYKERFIKHYGSSGCRGSIYMIYFYILTDESQNKNEKGIYENIYFSDAYLPFNWNDHRKIGSNDIEGGYKFSLFFPTGICKINSNDSQNSKIRVVAGEGDFYIVELDFELNNIIQSCVHDGREMDFNKYQYYLLNFFNMKSFVTNTPNEAFEIIQNKIKEESEEEELINNSKKKKNK